MVEVARPGETLFELRFSSREEFAREYDENLKNLGCYLPSDQFLPLFTTIQLRLSIPGREGTIELSGTIVHVATSDQPLPGLPPGMAVQLKPFNPENAQALEEAREGRGSAPPAEAEAPEPAGTAGAGEEAPETEGKAGEEIGLGDGSNLFQAVRSASLTDKIKMAKVGNRQVLSVLIQENEKQIMRFVMQNPRLGTAEIMQILKNPTVSQEIIQTVAKNSSLMQNDEVRYQVVINPKTPLPVALHALNSLNLKDLAKIAKSNSVKNQLKNNALRLLSQRR